MKKRLYAHISAGCDLIAVAVASADANSCHMHTFVCPVLLDFTATTKLWYNFTSEWSN